ncbi:ADAMTS-like protein 3 [Bactrocera neohumeralis]|uniref:ADAMTS-like protein 3 n=1 Tax=Bactrocera neohumeralis TaxID=98809 RepID=UPI0021652C9E|nr:ADAMTS-like protein 3 [Bactrocera neohumeralis]
MNLNACCSKSVPKAIAASHPHREANMANSPVGRGGPTCSRTYEDSVMQQIRHSFNTNGCKGESVRYRICNIQPYPEQQGYRAYQRAAYNDMPYDGTLYLWTPHYDYMEPCALTCRNLAIRDVITCCSIRVYN